VIVPYFSDWRTRRYTCTCGWSGSGDELASELYSELVEYSCATCEHIFLVIPVPTKSEVETAAAAGNDEARRMIAGFR
jgi:hypothetical protein